MWDTRCIIDFNGLHTIYKSINFPCSDILNNCPTTRMYSEYIWKVIDIIGKYTVILRVYPHIFQWLNLSKTWLSELNIEGNVAHFFSTKFEIEIERIRDSVSQQYDSKNNIGSQIATPPTCQRHYLGEC